MCVCVCVCVCVCACVVELVIIMQWDMQRDIECVQFRNTVRHVCNQYANGAPSLRLRVPSFKLPLQVSVQTCRQCGWAPLALTMAIRLASEMWGTRRRRDRSCAFVTES